MKKIYVTPELEQKQIVLSDALTQSLDTYIQADTGEWGYDDDGDN